VKPQPSKCNSLIERSFIQVHACFRRER
jgi:hypothetical protein